jgi:hypothetical protein
MVERGRERAPADKLEARGGIAMRTDKLARNYSTAITLAAR